MKKIILVRHAKSSKRYDTVDDIDRPLEERGWMDAYKMSKRVKELKPAPELFISSVGIRAFSTALIFARELRYDLQRIQLSSSIYESGVEEYIHELINIDDEVNSIAFFGHNPSMTWYAQHLCPSFKDEMPTCSVVIINSTEGSWKNVGAANCSLEKFIYPKQE
jgi:phosphohistidine phosphatase